MVTNATNGSRNLRTGDGRTADWAHAYTRLMGGSLFVLIPVVYDHPFLVHSSFNCKANYSINDIAWLCVYMDIARQFHSVMLSFLPDSGYVPGESFTGMVLVDDSALSFSG